MTRVLTDGPGLPGILDLCSHIVLNPEQIPADVWARVKKHYDDGQVVEIVATVGAYLQVSKFGDALGVQLEDVFTGHQPVLFAKDPPLSRSRRSSSSPSGRRGACPGRSRSW